MKANTPYQLKVTVEEFFEKTLKNEFAVFLRDNGLVVSPSRVEIGEFEDIAYFESGSVEYELPGMYWKYFDEVGSEEDAPETEPEAKIATSGELQASPNFVMTHTRTMPVINTNYNDKPVQISISPDWVNLESINDLDTSSVAAPNGDQLFMFYHSFVQRSGSRYYLGGKTTAEDALSKTKELYALHQRCLALEKLRKLIREEQAAVVYSIKKITEPKK